MSEINVQLIKVNPKAKIPCYMTELAAGLDLCACVDCTLDIKPGERVMVPTGIAIALPIGYEAQVRPRSGLAWRNGITLVNSPGTIDADYRGEIKVILINHGQNQVKIEAGERIAQMVVAPVTKVHLQLVSSLDDTARDSGGFGHTGK
ncbi:MAG: dUTP diphosphatase [Desulfuromonas sp.]|nr:dUTP diphosphatase [Desulfuromonas sp.]